MKKIINKISAFFLAAAIAVATVIPAPLANAAGESVDIIFTSDIHSHLKSFQTIFEGEYREVGGLAKIKTAIDSVKGEKPDALVLDGGDFSMGTIYHTLYESQASELRMLGDIGVEATTFGNHEFDFGSEGLSNMLNVAMDSNETVPQLLICNVDWDGQLNLAGVRQVKGAFDRYEVKPFTYIQKGGVNIALIGVFGKDALNSAPSCELKFRDPIEAVRETVAYIKNEGKADMIVLISHSGLGTDATTDEMGENLYTSGKSEDELMAKNVPDLDVILAGHSHTIVKQSLLYGNTHIIGCGEYSEYLGHASFLRRADGRWDMASYSLIPMTENVPEDEAVLGHLAEYEKIIDEDYLKQFDLSHDQILCTNPYRFDTVKNVYDNHTESNLGNLLSDSFRIQASKALGEPVDVAVVPAGCIRETFPVGDITVDDAFTSYSLGKGADGVVGYPLLRFYMTKKDLKTVAEVDGTLSEIMRNARLYTSGAGFSYNPHRIIMNRVSDIWLDTVNGREELEKDRLYSVVADMYAVQMIAAVKSVSKGLIVIEVRDENGNPVTDLNTLIIHEQDGTELKAWEAIAKYMEGFEDGVMPAKYEGHEGRKVVETGWSPVDTLKNPNIYTLFGIVVAIAALFFTWVIIKVVILNPLKYFNNKK